MPTCMCTRKKLRDELDAVSNFQVSGEIYLEASGTPVNKLNRSLRLDRCNSGIHIFRHNITAIQHAAGHVLAVSWIAFHHLICRLEASVCNFGNLHKTRRKCFNACMKLAIEKVKSVPPLTYRQLFVISLFGRNNRSICCQRKVNTRIRHQICLKFSQIDVQCTVKSQRCRNTANDLPD